MSLEAIARLLNSGYRPRTSPGTSTLGKPMTPVPWWAAAAALVPPKWRHGATDRV